MAGAGALARDREESVRVAYAAALATLASTSARFLQRAFATEDKAWDQSGTFTNPMQTIQTAVTRRAPP